MRREKKAHSIINILCEWTGNTSVIITTKKMIITLREYPLVVEKFVYRVSALGMKFQRTYIRTRRGTIYIHLIN